MVPADSRRIPRAPRYSGAPSPGAADFAYGALTLCGRPFQGRSAIRRPQLRWGSYNPGARLDGPGLGSSAFARRYLRNHVCFLFLRVLRCFSSPGWPPASQDGRVAPSGLPHSDIRGSAGICPSPRLFAACRVLLRLREPRHPSCALVSFPFFLSKVGQACACFLSIMSYL